MKVISFIISFFFIYSSGFSQKPNLDTSAFFKWRQVEDPLLNKSGTFFSYIVTNEPPGSQTLIVKATQNNWSLKFPDCRVFAFSEDSRFAAFRKGTDSLGVIYLGSSRIDYFPGTLSFNFFTIRGTASLVYKTKDKQIVILDLARQSERQFEAVDYWLFEKTGKLVLKQEKQVDGKKLEVLRYIDLAGDESKVFWEGVKASNFIWDASGNRIAFSAGGSAASSKTFWCYDVGNLNAVQLTTANQESATRELELNSISRFSKDGRRLFITVKRKPLSKADPSKAKVDVWTYHDAVLQSQQISDLKFYSYSYYDAVISITDQKLLLLEDVNFRLSGGKDSDDWAVCVERKGDRNERHWNFLAESHYFLVSKKDGHRKPLNEIAETNVISLSPLGKYIVYYNGNERNFFSYEIATGVTKAITKNATAKWTSQNDRPESKDIAFGVAGWFAGDSAVLLYDNNDIWKVALSSNNRPTNVTNGFGKKQGIVFRLASDYKGNLIPGPEKILLSAFNKGTKENGFYRVDPNKPATLELLTMGPYFYYAPDARSFVIDDSHNFVPLKADSSQRYVVRRMSAEASPNYFYTEDFKTFNSLSEVYPERGYNWIKTELITWKLFNGQKCQGILYKPDNFDSTKKYPVICFYYEKVSDGLHIYYRPQASDGPLNIPWFVSNGYLVFTPDIHYTTGQPGRSAYNAVVSAAKYLGALPYVDGKRIGLQGHSFGGFETNYIVSRTNLFRCAMSSSGASDAISSYLGTAVWGASNMSKYESQQHRLASTLWENQAIFLENSPVLYADKISTPLLLMHNINDGNVSFSQSIELFTALRRLGKKVWLLQYDNGTHGLNSSDRASTLDYTTRMTQFFNHYLKGKAAPRWMTRGIPASRKGIDDGLELDWEMNVPKNGLWKPR